MTIIADSAADLTVKDIETYDIKIAPLTINFPEGEVEATGISHDSFFKRLKAMAPNVPNTAQPSPTVFQKIFDTLPNATNNICITISSGLSGTANSADLASKVTASKNIQVIDSLTLSGGERFQVLAAAKASNLGWTTEAIKTRLKEIQKVSKVVFALETLEYLKRGGRIGRVQGLLGSFLSIKPVITVNAEDGKYDTLSRVRSMKKARASMLEYFLKEFSGVAVWVSVMHGDMTEEAEAFAQQLRLNLKVVKLEVLRISPVLAVHTGPGVVGAAVAPVELFTDLNLFAKDAELY